MIKNITIAFAAAALMLTSACAPDNDEYEQQLRDALGEAEVSLSQAISIAETETSVGAARHAKLQVYTSRQFIVSAYQENASNQYTIALSGDITGENAIDLSNGSCGSKTLGEIVAIAEAEVSGQGTSIELDDDEGCQYEVQVLTSSDLMEVEVTGEGAVTEVELSDDGGEDDDD